MIGPQKGGRSVRAAIQVSKVCLCSSEIGKGSGGFHIMEEYTGNLLIVTLFVTHNTGQA